MLSALKHCGACVYCTACAQGHMAAHVQAHALPEKIREYGTYVFLHTGRGLSARGRAGDRPHLAEAV